KIHRIGSRFIAADLYLPAKKLKIINVYGFQKHDFPTKGKAFNLSVIDHIKKAVSDGFHVITMGDFNANPDIYIHSLEQGRAPEKYFSLTAFLISNNFVDSHPVDASNRPYATFYQKPNIPTSRIDQIWFSESLNTMDFCFNRVWQPPSSFLSTTSRYQLDHLFVVLYFTKSLFIGDLPIHKSKQ